MDDRLSPFQLLILVLSIYVLGALAVDVLFTLSPEMSRLLHYIDLFVCMFFFADFCIRFRAARNKWRFMRWGWIDLVASIPAGWLFAGRLVRVVQVIRLLRAIKSLHMIWRVLFRNRAKGFFVSVTTVGYGDYYPITTLGRIVAAMLMVAGVGMFGSFAAYVGSLFVEEQDDENARQHRASRELIRDLYGEIQALRQEVAALREERDPPSSER